MPVIELPPMFAQLLDIFSGDATALDGLITKYIASGETAYREIEAGLEAGDAKLVRASAHRWKSASATVGAERVSALCAQIQDLADQENLDSVTGLMEQLATAQTEFTAWVGETLARLRAEGSV